MNTYFLAIGSVCAVVYIIGMFAGIKQDYMLEALDPEEFPLSSLYAPGFFFMAHSKKKGAFYKQLLKDTTLFFTQQYSEYYATSIMAQIISMDLLAVAFFFLLAGMTGEDGYLFAIMGVVVAVVFTYYFFNYVHGKNVTLTKECELEFPNAISKLALIVNSGVILHEAWRVVAEGKDGVFYDLMNESVEKMRNGVSDADAIYEFGAKTNSEAIKKFCSAMIQSIERGGADLTSFLSNQSTELWAFKRQTLLQKGESAASSLLLPVGVMFIGVILIVVAAAMQSFSF